jgi:hypothetical protein
MSTAPPLLPGDGEGVVCSTRAPPLAAAGAVDAEAVAPVAARSAAFREATNDARKAARLAAPATLERLKDAGDPGTTVANDRKGGEPADGGGQACVLHATCCRTRSAALQNARDAGTSGCTAVTYRTCCATPPPQVTGHADAAGGNTLHVV